MQHLTLREGLPKVREAFDNGLLGAFKYDTCMYEYPCGTMRCAIGVMLDDRLIEHLKVTPFWMDDSITLNEQRLQFLMERDLITLETNDEEIFIMLQALHDWWASLAGSDLSDVTRRKLERIGYIAADDATFGKELFLDFLTFLETNFV